MGDRGQNTKNFALMSDFFRLTGLVLEDSVGEMMHKAWIYQR